MVEVKFEHPPVYVTRSGVSYVKVGEILSSQAGQNEIEKAARVLAMVRSRGGARVISTSATKETPRR